MTTVRLPRRIGRVVVAGLACVAGVAALIGVASPAFADPPRTPPVTVSWSVAPSSAKGPDGRTHFAYTNIKPHSVINDYVGITNYSTKAVTFRVYATDGITTTAGSIGLAPAKQKAVDVGAWIHLEHNTVTIPPRARLNEPFTLSVPANATPGDHVGGVLASVTEGTNGGTVAREDRIGVAVYLRVTGTLQPTLGIESVSTSGYHGTPNPFGGGTTTVSYTVHNTGNVRLSANQTVSITGPFGIPLASVHPKALEELLPGGSVRVTTHVAGIFPLGPLGVHVKVTPVSVPGSPKIGVPLRTGTYNAGMWATPWPQLLLLIVLVALAFGIVRWRRARKGRQAAAVAAALEQGRREAAEQLTKVGGGEGSE